MPDQSTYPAKSDLTYSLGGRSGRSIIAFSIERAGNYLVNASYSESNGPQAVLAIGKGMVEGLFSSILISLAALFGSIAIAAELPLLPIAEERKHF